MKADLHVHSSYSDGNMSVSEIINYAKCKNIDVVAITDHDNLESIKDISKLQDDVLVIVGVELSTYYNDENIHILGYFYNNKINTDEVIAYLKELRTNRDKRIYQILDKLREHYNIIIDYNDVAKFSHGALGRVHVAKAISEKYGCTYSEAFDKYIGNNQKAYVKTTNFATEDAIGFLHRNNAIAVIAHPSHINKNAVEDIARLGVDGIEVYYSDHTDDDIIEYLEIANKYNLLVTGGSDFHGIGIRKDLGYRVITGEFVDKFLNKLNIKREIE